MKKLLLLLIPVFALSSCLTTAGDEAATETAAIEREDLFETGRWMPIVDVYGSTYVMTNEKDDDGYAIVGDEVHVDFEIIKKEKPNDWPFVEIMVETGKTLAGVSKITIEYKCDKDVKIALDQSDFGPEGDSSYAYYESTVGPADEWTTKTIDIRKFYQPSWATASSKAIGLNLENVANINIIPQPNYMKGEAATLYVRSLVIE